MSSGIRPERDVALFVDLAAWLAPRLPDPTWLGFVDWLQQWLAPESIRRLRHVLPLDTTEQQKAEKALAAWLGKPLRRAADKRELSVTIERDVDWATSWAHHGRMPVQDFIIHRRAPAVDRSLEGALCTLAMTWARVLRDHGTSDGHTARAEALTRAMRSHTDWSPGPLLPAHVATLRRYGPEGASLAETLRKVLGFWRKQITKDDNDLVRVARALAADHPEAPNINDLLELTIRIAAARAAVTADDRDLLAPGATWTLDHVVSKGSRNRRVGRDKPVLRLRSGPLHCELGKGRPREVRNGEPHPANDTLIPVQRSVGLDPDGNAPDLTLTLWLDSDPDNRLVVLGDAKRNAGGDGKKYLAVAVEVAAVYTVSYGHLADVEVRRGEVRAPVNPFMTLFCRQGVSLPELDREHLVDRLRDDATEMPFAVALDLERHFDLAEDGTWDGTVLAAWLGRVARLSARQLNQRRNAAGPWALPAVRSPGGAAGSPRVR